MTARFVTMARVVAQPNTPVDCRHMVMMRTWALVDDEILLEALGEDGVAQVDRDILAISLAISRLRGLGG